MIDNLNRSIEQELLESGVPPEKIRDLVKKASVIVTHGQDPEYVPNMDFFKPEKKKRVLRDLAEGMTDENSFTAFDHSFISSF